MTKATVALAAALLACTTLSSAAEAGGVRVGFGFPLGSFVARPHQSYSAAPSYERHCAKTQRVARHTERNEALVHKVRRAKKVEVAEAPAPRKIKRAPKVEVAEAAPAPRKIKRTPKIEVAEKPVIKTAKLEDKSVASDAAPSVYVPEATAAATPPADVKTTAPATVTTAAVAPATSTDVSTTTAPAAPAATAIKEEVKVEAPKAEKVEKTEKAEAKIKLPTDVKRLCRRFSAAIAGLIDVPCE
ncbi:MAG: hypothetical protein HOP09_10270 [Hyphomicrobium sp.]|nr:hypothetical protein [Hyphomicrobium sp.]